MLALVKIQVIVASTFVRMKYNLPFSKPMYDVNTFIFHSYSKPNLGMHQTSLAYKTCCFEDIKLLNNNLLNIHLFRNDSYTARMQLAAVDLQLPFV